MIESTKDCKPAHDISTKNFVNEQDIADVTEVEIMNSLKEVNLDIQEVKDTNQDKNEPKIKVTKE